MLGTLGFDGGRDTRRYFNCLIRHKIQSGTRLGLKNRIGYGATDRGPDCGALPPDFIAQNTQFFSVRWQEPFLAEPAFLKLNPQPFGWEASVWLGGQYSTTVSQRLPNS